MQQIDDVLKMYADAGMKSVEDWGMSGRELVVGVQSRAGVVRRGVMVSLYTRDQTQIRPRSATGRR